MAITGVGRARRFFREPLLHFLLIGLVTFLAYTWVSSSLRVDRIVISAALVEGVCQDHFRRTGDAPSPRERQALIDNLVDDEVLVREARAMGIDKGDPILRRRLIQKMGFLIEGGNPIPEPTESELQAFLRRNRKRYTLEERISLTHVYLEQRASEDRSESDVEQLLEALSNGADPGQRGDPFVLGTRFVQRSKKELAAKFGPGFAEAVMAVPKGLWCGPIRSSYGNHLVLVTEKTAGREPNLEEVRPRVVREWKAEKREEARRLAIRRLRDRYVIRTEGRDGRGGA